MCECKVKKVTPPMQHGQCMEWDTDQKQEFIHSGLLDSYRILAAQLWHA